MKKEKSIREIELIFDKMDKSIILCSGDVFDVRAVFYSDFIPNNFIDLCWTFYRRAHEN